MYAKYWKRLFDFSLSVMACIVLSPVLLILTVAGAIAMRGNPFFTQLRPGKDEKLFRLIKFRTMTDAKDANGNLLPDAQRLNAYGRWLRSSSLDELPSLCNILAGQLSIVGPRPLLVRDMVFMTPEVRKRHTVLPGLTGLAQCNGRDHMSWEKKFAYDLTYIKSITLLGDMKIIFKTAVQLFRKEGIAAKDGVSAEDFGDYLLHKGVLNEMQYTEKQRQAENLLQAYAEKHLRYLYCKEYHFTASPAFENDFLRICAVKVFKPTLFSLRFAGRERISLSVLLSRLYFWLITFGKYRIYYLLDGDRIVHFSYVVPRCVKFPFLGKNEYVIGPSVTSERYRRKGSYVYMLDAITSLAEYKNATFYMIVSADNLPSVKGIEKAGFIRCGRVSKTRISKIFRLEK